MTLQSIGRSPRAVESSIAIEHHLEVPPYDRDFETLSDICGLRLLIRA
jgi:hypothetical protein